MSAGKSKVEDEDFDDLDDVLDDWFTKPQAAPSHPQPTGDALSDEFAKQLAAEMETMLHSLGGDGSASTSAPSSSSAAPGPPPEKEEDPFQKSIRQAMEKLEDSDNTLKADSKPGQDTLEGLLSSLGDLKLGEDGGESGEDLESMLEVMMSQLMSKEILYEPLKELDTKYPEYLVQHGPSLSPEDLSRYENQKTRVSEIVAIFESASYSDENAAQSTEVLRLMNEMQSFGTPPSEIMGPMPPGFDFSADGLPKLPDGCIIA